jgi:cellulose biosynthesis protein BcsQ
VTRLKRRTHYQPGIFNTVPTTLTVLHPKGGVGRSTTVYMLGAELALRGHRVALIDRDQGQHLSRVFDFYPPTVDNLVLGEDPSASLRIVDTAPEVNADRAVGYLREADWALVPVKGPEAGSVLALPLLLEWLEQAQGARLLGFVPTMYKGRRGDSR